MPRSPTGEAACHKELFESVSKIPGVKWGRLPKEMLRLGKSEDAGERFVHAKIYRFFNQNPKREIYFIGSANLTSPAHQNGGNVETGLLIDRIPPRRPDFWLLLDESIPGEFQVPAEDDEPAVPSGSRLRIRYLWDQRRALAFGMQRENLRRLQFSHEALKSGRYRNSPHASGPI